MYDELVKELRDSAEWADRLALLMDRAEGDTHAPIMRKAADAIEQLDMITDNLNYLYKTEVPKWIPVTERLPESVHEYVLCCGAKGGQFVGWVGTGFITGGKVIAFQHGGKGRYITHWMPLPEPPKEEEE